MEHAEKHNRKKVIGLFLTLTMILSLICNISISTLASATETTNKTVASIQLPNGWSTPVKIYYYTSNSNNGWPGTEMTDMGNGKYSFTLPDDIDSANLLFNCNNGKTQIPGSGQPGFLIKKGENKIYTNGTWKDDEKIDETLGLKEFSASLASPQEIGTTINLNASAAGGNGTLSYEFSVSKDNGQTFTTIQDYSALNTCTWTPSEIGTYILKATVKDGQNENDSKTINFTIKKHEEITEAVASIQLPDGWSAPLKIYYYTSSSNNGWPGTEMTDMGNGKYSFTLPNNIESANVIFNCNNGRTQIPGSGQPGFLIKKGENKIYTKGTWKDDEKIDEALSLKEFTASLASPQEIGNTINLTASAVGGSGELSYEFSISKDGGKTFDVVQDYSNIKTYNWTPTEVGEYVLRVQVKDENNDLDNKTMDYIINKNVITPKIKSITPKNDSTIIQNKETSITIDATGTEILFYKVQIIGPDGEYVDKGHYTTSNVYKFTPIQTGKYTINISVQLHDEDNTTTTQTIYYNVKSDKPSDKYLVNITANIPEGGKILGGNGEYEPGEIVTIEPYVNSGYDFVGFTGSPQKVIDSISYCKFVMPEEDVTIVANFKKKPTQDTYKLTAETNGEYFGSTTGTGQYKPGELVTIKAIPKDGVMFRGWSRISGDIDLEDNTLDTISFIMPEYDVTFRAQFITISDTKIIAKSFDESTGEVSGDINTTVKTGTEVTLVAEPKAGYKFVGWYNSWGGTRPLSTDSTWTFKAFDYTNVVAKFEAEV